MKPTFPSRLRVRYPARRKAQVDHHLTPTPRLLLALSPALSFWAVFALALPSHAATRTWIGGNVDWVDNGSPANWNPADEPDSDDDAVFNTANSVNLGSANTVLSLALSNGISINTKNFNLAINGLLQLTGAGTDLTIGGSDSTVWGDGITLTTSSRIYLENGVLALPHGAIDNNAGCTVSGRGIIALNSYVAAAKTLFDNDGTLAAAGAASLTMPAAGSLVINAGYTAARIDLDGTSETGIVNVGRNQLLDINVASGDYFGGTMNLSHASSIDIASGWNMNAGTLNATNGATTVPKLAANSSFIAGGTFTLSGGTITVVDTDGTLQFDSPFLMTGGNLVNNGLVVFSANATIGTGANFTMPGNTSSLTVNSGVEVNIDQANFNPDGAGSGANVITVNSGGILDLDLGIGADEVLSGLVRLNGGELDVTTVDHTWGIDALTVGADTGTSQINGEAVDFYAATSIGANAVLRVNAASTLNSTSSFAVAAGATLGFVTAPVFNGASFTGAGIMRVEGSSTVAANTTIAVNTFDWDWNALGNTHTINTGVTFTINSPDWFDAMNDNITLQGSGSTLNVNGPAEWKMYGALNSNPAAAGTATVGGTSRVIFGDAINANSGITAIAAPATLTDTSLITVGSGALLSLNGDTVFRGGGAVGLGTLRVNNTSTVTANTTVAVDTFDWDGTGAGTLQAINDGVTFTIDSPNFDTDGDMDDPLTLGGSGATLKVNSLSSWTMLKTLTTNPANTGVATIGGSSRLILSSAGGILNANGDTTISAPVTLGPDSTTNVAAAALLTFSAANTTFNGGSVAGAGTLRVGSSSSVTANTTIAVNTFDWDGTLSGSLHTIADGVAFTINSPIFDDDGSMDDRLTLGSSGATLTVNGPASWEMGGTLTTNTADAGMTTISGTSRMILADRFVVNGDTTISAETTFGPSSLTTVFAPAILTLNSVSPYYSGGGITGAGHFNPASNNIVTASTAISVASFNFDRGAWTLNPGANLTVAVTDYDPDIVINAFDNILTINDATLKVTSADATFVMDGTMSCNASSLNAAWGSGSSTLVIGNDSGTLDADLNITGTAYTQIGSDIDFKSDADVDIAAGATLQLLGVANFNSVNAANNAEFTGAGQLQTNRAVYFNEATTLNMVGGTVDLDGADAIGDTIYIKAPVIINAATLDSFGNINNSGANILDVNHATASGTLSVNLDNPSAEWTLNFKGVLRLANNAAAATLLGGSDANLNGYVQISGDVRSDARLDIGGTIEIQTAAKPFRLSGGDLSDINTIAGGTINGPGILGADSLSSLYGYGTINTDIDFDGNADLLADDGTLTINGSILDARYVGTNRSDGILNVVNAWDSDTISGVRLTGGELRGGTLTNKASGGISGSGLVSSRVINNSTINANHSGATLLVETASNNNDWDGDASPATGQLLANAGTLEIRSITMGGVFPFKGAVTVVNGGTVFASGFALGMEPASALNLSTGTFKQSNGMLTGLSGTITVGAGVSTLLGATTGGFKFNNGSATALTGTLQLDCPTTTIQPTATFTGAGILTNLSPRRLAPDNSADVNVLVENRGILAPGGTAVARNDVRDFIQTASGVLELNLNGSVLNTFDRLIVNGNAQLAGSLQLTLGGGYVPALNDTLVILSATAGVTGTFGTLVQPAGMPAGLTFEASYNPTNVQLKVVSSTPYDSWINTFGITDPAQKTKAADPDGDGLNNLGEFALDGDPTSGANNGKIVGKIAPVDGIQVFTLTLPLRYGAVLDPDDPAGGELGLKHAADCIFYTIQASDDLLSAPLTVTEVTGPDAAAIRLGLPPLNLGWTYRTFRSPGPVAGDPIEFMRVKISD